MPLHIDLGTLNARLHTTCEFYDFSMKINRTVVVNALKSRYAKMKATKSTAQFILTDSTFNISFQLKV